MAVLADLQNQECGVISKVMGYGAFRKRINEMGFVVGTKVTAIKKAPLQDPVEYEIMSYRVSLRESEARRIEIVSKDHADEIEDIPYNGTITEELLQQTVQTKTKHISIALVGNPNCGKTTLFNYATGKHERVGNYGGVTVDVKTAKIKKFGYTFHITDLPGTYSLSEYSPEELFVRSHLAQAMPDVVINVIDTSNIKRNLYLTTQLIDMNIKVVGALNMYDELENKGDDFDYTKLGTLLGIPFVPTTASKGKGLDELLQKVVSVHAEQEPTLRHIHINYGYDIMDAIRTIRVEIDKHQRVSDIYHKQYIALKLLEKDSAFTEEIVKIPETKSIIECAQKERKKIEKKYNDSAETIITDAKYSFIRGALKETYTLSKHKQNKALNKGLDALLTHKWFGFPVFLFFMWAMFQLTFSLGSYPMDWIDSGVTTLGQVIGNNLQDGMLRDLIVDGIIGGVGGVIIFLPNILILFFCISLMEDTGYMARAAFIMDRIMHKMGLHGKSFIPLLMGFGCNVPAIMATRTLDNKKDRILTMLIIPFMSCSARLPVYVLLISAFFPFYQGLILFGIYVIGVLISVVVALVFKRIFFAKKDVPFVMELPPYRKPTLRNTLIHMWGKSVQYIQKMGTVILVASILIWALGHFPRNAEHEQKYEAQIEQINQNQTISEEEKQEDIIALQIEQKSTHLKQSYIGRIGHAIAPVLYPIGFDWKIGVSIFTGLAAKEIVVSTMGVLYQSDLEADEESVSLQNRLQEQVHDSGPLKGQKVFTPLVAFALMLFVLIYFPCVAVIAAIKREANWKWAVFTMFYTTGLAWLVSFATYQIGMLY
ncbi:MAG: ferrous iron transport protein B [Bacteroidales bacterium]|jgi:ferrous iron transport protein B|nr:ferrous iron transport protein B [Bacteroidales bacterium]